MRRIANRVGQFFRGADEFLRSRHKHAGNRVVRIGPIDAVDKERRHGNRVPVRHGRQRSRRLFREQPGVSNCLRGVERPAHVSTGVHWTSCIERAPEASITRRSNPSATPQAFDIQSSASRKSSSIG